MTDPHRPALTAAAAPARSWDRDGIAGDAPPLRYRPIWNVQQKAIAISVCEPAEGGDTASPEGADCALLRHVLAGIDRAACREGAGAVCLPVHHATLSDAASRSAFVALCETISPAQRATLLWEILGSPRDICERALFSMVSTLKPYGRAIFLRGGLADADFDIPAAVGVHSIGIDLGTIPESEAEIVTQLEKFAENAHRSGLRCHVHGLTTSSLSLAAVSCGFDYLAGDAIAESGMAPWGVRPFDAESLFLRPRAGAEA